MQIIFSHTPPMPFHIRAAPNLQHYVRLLFHENPIFILWTCSSHVMLCLPISKGCFGWSCLWLSRPLPYPPARSPLQCSWRCQNTLIEFSERCSSFASRFRVSDTPSLCFADVLPDQAADPEALDLAPRVPAPRAAPPLLRRVVLNLLPVVTLQRTPSPTTYRRRILLGFPPASRRFMMN